MRKTVLAVAAGCVLALTIAAFVVGSPFGGSIRAGDLAGSWNGPHGAQLTFREDGTLTAVDVPTDFSDGDGTPIRHFSGSGSWNLAKKAFLVDQQLDVTLDQADGAKTGVRLRALGDGEGVYIPLSEDSPKKFTFRKS